MGEGGGCGGGGWWLMVRIVTVCVSVCESGCV